VQAPTASRRDRFDALEQNQFDVLIIGGGATGAATARDAALRGLKVALCEQGDFASQTSSYSSKLLHGGIRYLQYFELQLVREGLLERRRLMRTAPHLCRPVDFVFPAYKGSRPGLLALGLGVSLYNALSLWREPRKNQKLSRQALEKSAPLLRSEGLKGARVYTDCQTNDARLVLENILDAESAGATCVSYAEAISLRQNRAGIISGATVRDRRAERAVEIRAHAVVNAAGPFSDRVCALDVQTQRNKPRIRPTLGVHLVIDSDKLPTGGRAFVLNTPQDGRVFFILPYGTRTLVGTTDTDWHPERGRLPAPTDTIEASRADVSYLLEALATTHPNAHVTEADVVSCFAGLRPLIASNEASVSATSREHDISDNRRGLVTVAGGKLTTMRKMGAEATDAVLRALAERGFPRQVEDCSTENRPLPGAAGPPPSAASTQFNSPQWHHLVSRYGSRAALFETAGLNLHMDALRNPALISDELPDLRAEIIHAMRFEHAVTPEDVLRRRLSVFTNARHQGLKALNDVVALMSAEAKWSAEQTAEETRAYQSAVEKNQQWRTG